MFFSIDEQKELPVAPRTCPFYSVAPWIATSHDLHDVSRSEFHTNRSSDRIGMSFDQSIAHFRFSNSWICLQRFQFDEKERQTNSNTYWNRTSNHGIVFQSRTHGVPKVISIFDILHVEWFFDSAWIQNNSIENSLGETKGRNYRSYRLTHRSFAQHQCPRRRNWAWNESKSTFRVYQVSRNRVLRSVSAPRHCTISMIITFIWLEGTWVLLLVGNT